MNANELADKLQELDSKLHLIELFKSATMLRQQQAEIAQLKHMNLNWQISEGMLLSELDALKAHPVKELTDEEILHIYNESYRNTLMGIDPLAFARAIEERHGIK